MLAKALGSELVLPPAMHRASFAGETEWFKDPTEILLDVEAIAEYWNGRGMHIHAVSVHLCCYLYRLTDPMKPLDCSVELRIYRTWTEDIFHPAIGNKVCACGTLYKHHTKLSLSLQTLNLLAGNGGHSDPFTPPLQSCLRVGIYNTI